eukprot:m.16577 g.16577  ORF g.16577 m.16577 type:complete len:441 (-) comp5063_c0_seq1:97-1419(-)
MAGAVWVAVLAAVAHSALFTGGGLSTDPTCGDVTVGECCGGDPSKGRIDVFPSRNASACCQACRNRPGCTSWTLNANSSTETCTLRSECDGFEPGNCTRGDLPGPASCGTVATAPCCGNASSVLATPGSNLTASACCQACLDHGEGCAVWSLNASGGCTLRSLCAAGTRSANCTIGHLPPSPPPKPPGPPPSGLSYRFVGFWRGVHFIRARHGHSSGNRSRSTLEAAGRSSLPTLEKVGNGSLATGRDNDGSGGLSEVVPATFEEVGDCGCALIAPEWIITAEHCAERVLKHEPVHVHIYFHGDEPRVERTVSHCIRATTVDVAICHLTVAVHAFPPVWINPEIYRLGHHRPNTYVYTIGTKDGLDPVYKRLEYEASGAHLYVKRGGGMKAGDSGGPWVQEAHGSHFLVGVLHGSGIAGQPSWFRKFLDDNVPGITWVQP